LSGILVVGAARFTWLQFLLGTRQAAFALSGQQLLADASLVHHRYDDRFLRYKNVERVARDVGVMWVLREPDIFRDSEENCFWDPGPAGIRLGREGHFPGFADERSRGAAQGVVHLP
jgi:hypothetical protein